MPWHTWLALLLLGGRSKPWTTLCSTTCHYALKEVRRAMAYCRRGLLTRPAYMASLNGSTTLFELLA